MLGNASRLGLRLSQIGKVTPGSRRVATSGAALKNFAQVPKELQKKMVTFQVDNGLPVHIRGGIVDKVLMAFTYVVCGLGLLDCCRVYYVLSYPAEEKK
ncbi:cytochrome c oxidase subunit 7A2, mitochondrial-like [Penaeus monodon]|uniref:cytochrome c oxidase subunit 7A2, mitochondrial-like n=1 Tax=Penaeus monodon TaxID=6687 RepID=UPI0018A71F44|nr:cytochrome c oxidase subunit 7A2, mitochondrial-like [Penaeus monodon]XP_037788869.1 cytochrome c oxidase subunit 7A2, mitochondrial-like [Penaeus monodon]